jgi:cell fate regulator YaaT (PSP1 superfamily)
MREVMPIYPLPVITEEEEEKALAKLTPPKSVVVRYGYLKQIAEIPYDGGEILGCGTKLVVRTPRGVELGEMLTTTCSNSGCGKSVSRKEMLEYIDRSGGKQYPFVTEGRVLRVANSEDLQDQVILDKEKRRYVTVAKAAIKELGLAMKLIEAEPLISRDRIIFYFSAEGRVDFRDMVRQLAKELHVRVEMRQVGARDEARIVADYEKCGQHCCCKQFLKVLKPVSMRSAKIQKATLDPAKISGRCGRLMCCLRYEDETYDELRKRLPHRKTKVVTEEGVGIVVSTQILTQLVLIELDHNYVRNAYPLENIEMFDPEKHDEKSRLRGAEPEPPPEPVVTTPTRDPDKPKSKRRRGRGRRKGEGQGQGQQGEGREQTKEGKPAEPRRPQPGKPLDARDVESKEGAQADRVAGGPAAKASGGEEGEGGAKKKRRRRRRRRKRKDGGGGSEQSSGGSES